MIVPKTLDIDWLHATVELLLSGRYRHRREGKTVAYLMLMLGEIELGGPQNVYLYIGETSSTAYDVKRELIRVVEKTTDAHVEDMQTKVWINEQLFLFYSIDTLIQQPGVVKGWTLDRIFMDIDDRTQRRLDKEGRLNTLFTELLPQLSYRRGDVI